MYGQDILYGISKVPFEIPHKISYPYIEICVFTGENLSLRALGFEELVSVFETSPWSIMVDGLNPWAVFNKMSSK